VDARTGETIGEVLDLDGFASLAFASSPARDAVALGGAGGEIRIGRTADDGGIDLDVLVEPEADAAPPTGLAFTSDGRALVVVHVGEVVVLDATSGEVRRREVVNRAATVATSPSSDVLAIGRDDGAVLLLDLDTLEPLGPPLAGHTEAVRAVAVSDDGQILASVADDGTVRLWDLPGRRSLGPPLPTVAAGDLPAVSGGSLAFTADGTRLLAPGPTGVTAWRIGPREWIEQACRVAGRDLTEAEWDAYVPPGLPYRRTCS
jgi:WD40 repeat protein